VDRIFAASDIQRSQPPRQQVNKPHQHWPASQAVHHNNRAKLLPILVCYPASQPAETVLISDFMRSRSKNLNFTINL